MDRRPERPLISTDRARCTNDMGSHEGRRASDPPKTCGLCAGWRAHPTSLRTDDDRSSRRTATRRSARARPRTPRGDGWFLGSGLGRGCQPGVLGVRLVPHSHHPRLCAAPSDAPLGNAQGPAYHADPGNLDSSPAVYDPTVDTRGNRFGSVATGRIPCRCATAGARHRSRRSHRPDDRCNRALRPSSAPWHAPASEWRPQSPGVAPPSGSRGQAWP